MVTIVGPGITIGNGVIIYPNGLIPLAGSLSFAGGSTSHGGSYLSLVPGITIGGGAYCIEGWFKLPNFTQAYGIMGANADYGLSLFVGSSTSFTSDSYGGHGAFSYTVPTMSINTWYYFALTRNSSNKETLFLGSTPGGTAARSTTGLATNNLNYNTSGNTTNDIATYYGQEWPGYLTNIRVVNGSTPYDPNLTSITVPNQPLTAITNTQYLMLGDSTTSDASGVQTVTSHGTVTQSSSQKPF
jgi:Concanavalin A-like lectin/glucanases superfamily